VRKQFYSHIIQIDTLSVALGDLEITEKEKEHLEHLIDSNLYHTILDAILAELSDEDKHTFLNHLATEDHAKTMAFLEKRIDNIEDKIKKTADELISELHQDIKETKKR
jgi:2C-methyl-D-erythritol 2,4-cyclodiphosphate synthase